MLSNWLVTSLADDGSSGTLRWAVQQSASDDTIEFDPSLTQNGPATIALNDPPLEINGSIEIDGPGADSLTIDGAIKIDFGSSATIDDVTIQNGGIYNSGNLDLRDSTISGCGIQSISQEYQPSYEGGAGSFLEPAYLGLYDTTVTGNVVDWQNGAGIDIVGGSANITSSQITNNRIQNYGSGGGISNDRGDVTINDSVISGNYAGSPFDYVHGGGGGIFNKGSLTITFSTITGNNTPEYGGGVASEGSQASLTISNSTISDNEKGISSLGSGELAITNSTVSGNYGGGVLSQTADLTNCTIANNAAGPGLYANYEGESYGTTLTDCTISGNSVTTGVGAGGIMGGANLAGTIVAGNTGGDLSGTFTGTYNLVGDGSGGLSTDPSAHNILGTTASPIDPNLGALTPNTDAPATMPLLDPSPAVGAGGAFGLTKDERGAPRFDSFDIGAYQSNPMHIFDGTKLGGDYDFGSIGVPNMVVAGSYWDQNGEHKLFTASGPSQFAAQSLAAEAAAGSGYLCFDVEGKPPGFTGDYYAGLVQLVTWARQVDPSLKIGFWGDEDFDLAFEDLNSASAYANERIADQNWLGMSSGTYNEADDVYRATDFICPVDYPAEYDSWLYQRLADLEVQDAKTDAAPRTVTDTDGTIVEIPKKPIYVSVSAQYLENGSVVGAMAADDLRAIFAQLDVSADGILIWEAGGQGFDNWFTGLSNFAEQQPQYVTPPILTANANTMQLSWTDSNPTVQGFEIYRSVHGANDWIKVGYTPADLMTWADQQMRADITEPGTPIDATFDYKVRAITGVPGIDADSNIADATGSGIAPGRDGYAQNLAVGWTAESSVGETSNWATTASDLDVMEGPETSGGWVEYNNVNLPSGATSLDLNLAMVDTTSQLTIKVWYGAAPGDPGSVLAGSLVVVPTTSQTSVWNFKLTDFANESMSVDIPASTDSDIYIQFVSSEITPNNLVWMRGWNFVV